MRDSRQKILLQSFMLGAEQRGLGSALLTALKCFDRRDLELVECVRIRFDLSQRIDLGLRQRFRQELVNCGFPASLASIFGPERVEMTFFATHDKQPGLVGADLCAKCEVFRQTIQRQMLFHRDTLFDGAARRHDEGRAGQSRQDDCHSVSPVGDRAYSHSLILHTAACGRIKTPVAIAWCLLDIAGAGRPRVQQAGRS